MTFRSKSNTILPLTESYNMDQNKVRVDFLRVGHVIPPVAAKRRADDFKAEQKHERARKLAVQKQRKQLREEQERRNKGLLSTRKLTDDDTSHFTMSDAIAILQQEAEIYPEETQDNT